MSRDINNKYWDEELETLPREELEKRQLADLQEIVKFAYDKNSLMITRRITSAHLTRQA